MFSESFMDVNVYFMLKHTDNNTVGHNVMQKIRIENA